MIADLYDYPKTALNVLRAHHKILQYTDHFISMSTDMNVASEILTRTNLKRLLKLLPQRVRMTDPKLGVAGTNTGERYLQYEAFKKWTTDNLQILIRLGFGMEDEVKTEMATIGEIKENMIKNEERLEIDESAPSNQDRYYPEYEFVQAEHEEASLEAHVNNDKIYTEHHDEREEFEAMDPCTANDPYSVTLRIKPEKINN